jgi:hypothetical protein
MDIASMLGGVMCPPQMHAGDPALICEDWEGRSEAGTAGGEGVRGRV